jgi:3-phenylpropionate/trans-cinnamate dioxygenase ferredoxin reductase subunit
MLAYSVVIVGSGHGGANVALSLRRAGFKQSILVVSKDEDLPYERPPLSKEYLTGEKPFERICLRSAHVWRDREISLELGAKVIGIDTAARSAHLEDGRSIRYEHLVWAAGGEPRRLTCSGHELAGVHVLRTRADADQLRTAVQGTRRAVIVGGGYIGLESAAVLRKMGIEVVLVEAMDRVLRRGCGAEISRFLELQHRAHQVRVITSETIDAIHGAAGRVSAVRLRSGETIAAEVVIAGLGIVPSVEPLSQAGAETVNGVLIDERCRTTLPGIYAIGDCASHLSRFFEGGRIRLESVQNAVDQAHAVAMNIAGNPTIYNAVPTFWSNQYDFRIQSVGISAGHDDAVVRGDPQTRSFSVVYLMRGKVLALDCVNSPQDFVQGRRLVLAGAKVSAQRLGDRAIPLVAT